MTKLSVSLLSFTLALSLSGMAAVAGPLADAGAKVDAAVAAGDFQAWQVANQALLEAAWQAPGLHFDSLVLVDAPAAGYGGYTPRANNIYPAGSHVLIYAEPAGFGYGDRGNGTYGIGFDIDLILKDATGATLTEIPNIMAIDYSSRAMAREFVANIDYDLATVPAGSYTLETVFHDKNGGQSASFESAIIIQ